MQLAASSKHPDIACLTDYLTDRQLPLCKMVESEAERGPFLQKKSFIWSSYPQNIVWKEEYNFVKGSPSSLITVNTHSYIKPFGMEGSLCQESNSSIQ